MEDDVVKCGIVKQNSIVTLVSNNDKQYSAVTLLLGVLVRIVEVLEHNYVIIQVNDYDNRFNIFKDTVWFCELSDILVVDPELWNFLPGVISPLERVQLVQNSKLCDYLILLKLNMLTKVLINEQSMLAKIRYIGPVEEMGPGFYFGLELLGENKNNGSCNGCYALKQYFTCHTKAGVFVSANCLMPIETNKKSLNPTKSISLLSIADVGKNLQNKVNSNVKFEKLDHTSSLESIFSNLNEDCIEEKPIAFTSLSSDSQRNDSGKRSWKLKVRAAGVKSASLMHSSENIKNLDKLRLISSDEESNDPFEIRSKSEKPCTKTINSDVIRTNLKSSDQTVPEHKKYLIKNMHKKSASASGADFKSVLSQTDQSKETHTSVTHINIDNHYSDKNVRNFSNSHNQTKNSTSKNLYTSEYVFSDPNINRSHVEMNDNHGSKSEMDLIELLSSAGQWPSEAGDTIAPILSNNSYNYSSTTSERNKSINPISHIVNTRKKSNAGKVSIDFPLKNEISSKLTDVSNKTVFKTVKNIDTSQSKGSQAGSSVGGSNFYDTPERQLSPPPNSNETKKYTIIDDFDLDTLGLGIGSLVEVTTDVSDPLYGVIRWISTTSPKIAGIELEEEQSHLPIELTDGVYNNHRYFTCPPGKALFVPIDQCHVDQRFQEMEMHIDTVNGVNGEKSDTRMFGQHESPVVTGAVAPLSMQTVEQAEEMCGKYRGIQGHHNSCYLDATLFAMFACTAVFDSLLFRPRSHNDIERYEEVQRVLREEIVNPLRQNLYVRADRVMKLRTLLEELSSVSGLTSEEKDPEEFLNSLLAQILRAEPLLKLNSGQEAFYYQLFVEKDERLALPSVQQLFEQSFLASNIKLKEVPSCLIIQMPRFGKSYKMYPRIIPSLLLDVTDIIEDSPRQCTVCGKLAEYECIECIGQCGEGLESTAFCSQCRELTHAGHAGRTNHHPVALHVPHDFRIMAEHCPTPPRLYMELFAVVCIETSHYVAFVKCGSGHEAPWCFFDSMADRKGEQNGYNIPEIVACPGLAGWLGEEVGSLPARVPQLPEPARRLLSDAYLCLYQSPDVMMYR